MKVYLVTDGSYSDYRVLAVCSTWEEAEKAKIHFNAGNGIEEWELDEYGRRDDGLLAWRAVVRITDLTVTSVDRMDTSLANNWSPDISPSGDGESVCIQPLMARDAEHVRKIAADEAVKYLATPGATLSYAEYLKRWFDKHRK